MLQSLEIGNATNVDHIFKLSIDQLIQESKDIVSIVLTVKLHSIPQLK